MCSRSSSNDLEYEFCQVTGSTEDVARSFLIACNNDLNSAVSLYMDDPTNVPALNYTETCRSPIPQRNEQLIPVEIPRIGNSTSHSRRAFVAEDSDDSSDDLVVPSNGYKSSSNNLKTKRHIEDTHVMSGQNSSSKNVTGVANGSKSVVHKKRKHLQQLFKPPVELMFNGSLAAAQLASQEKLQWLLVSVHDEGCFECHLLNRDVWKDPNIYQLIKRHFTFLQIIVDSPEGVRYRSRHTYVQGASHIALLDPFTGEQKMMWTHLHDPKLVYSVISEFLDHTNLLPSTSQNSCVNTITDHNATLTTTVSPCRSDSVVGNHIFDSKTTVDENVCAAVANDDEGDNHGVDRLLEERRSIIFDCTTTYQAKRPRLQYFTVSKSTKDQFSKNPLDLSEEEQLEMAIEASKQSIVVNPNHQAELSRDEIILSDDDSDDVDTVRINQTYSIPEHSQRTLEADDCNDNNNAEDCKLIDTSNDSSSTTLQHNKRQLGFHRPTNKFSTLTNTSDACMLIGKMNSELPISPIDEATFELLFRFPDGHREIHRLHPDSKLQDLHNYFTSRGFPFSDYEIVRVRPPLHLSDLNHTTIISQTGLCPKDTLFLQER